MLIALAGVGDALAQDRGSFQPPIFSTDTDAHYVTADVLVVLAGDLTIGGVVGSVGFGLGDGEHPLFGIEVALSGLYGGGTIKTGDGMGGAAFGDLSLSLLSASLSPVFKMKPVDDADNGWVGLTLYGGPLLGTSALGITNDFGTVVGGSLLLGGSGGGVVTLQLLGYVTLIGFGGVQYIHYQSKGRGQDLVSPQYGGNLKIHITRSWTIDVGATLSQLQDQFRDDEKKGAQTFTLGFTWRRGEGLPSVRGGPVP